MIDLNLPRYNLKIEYNQNNQVIFDIIRKKYVVLTPEEWVRQNFIHYLIQEKGVPKGLMKVESGLTYNNLKKRADIEILDRNGEALLVIECKAPKIPINESVLRQVSVYNQIYQAPYIGVTNGLQHYAFFIDFTKQSYTQLQEYPEYDAMENKKA